jgi:mevalonate kinase
MCASARAAGALGAKLTGAGGGGCVLALVDGPACADAVLAAWKRGGFDGFVASVGCAPGQRLARAPLLEEAP